MSGDECLGQAVEIIAEQLRLSFAGIYLTDTTKTWAILRAGSGKAGRVLLEHKHQLKIDKSIMSSVGQAILTDNIWVVEQIPPRGQNQTELKPDVYDRVYDEANVGLHFVSAKPVRYCSPLIPTRWYLVFPLRKAKQPIGALVVYTDQVNDFHADDFIYLQRLADQMMAIIEVRFDRNS
jgi:GAF domain-containing protein